MARTLSKAKSRRESGTFAALPHVVMDSEDYRALSGSAHKVLMCLLRQFRGNNNGDLSAPFSSARKWGIGSRTTLARALEELQERRLILCTRVGHFMNPGGRCALFAVTWRSIDACGGKIDASPTTTPPRKFSLEQSNRPVQKMD